MTDPESGARAAMGLVMVVLSILGVVLIKNAVDLPMSVFGTTLFIFGGCYLIGLLRQHYDAIDRAGARSRQANAAAAKMTGGRK